MKLMTLIALLAMLGTVSCRQSTRPDASSAWGCGNNVLEQAWAGVESRISDAEDARKLAVAVLCLPQIRNPEDYIRDHLNDQVKIVSFGTGDLVEERIVLDREAAKAEVGAYHGSPEFAYNLSLGEAGELILEAQNEACYESVVLRYRRSIGQWTVSEYGSACD